MIRAAAPAFVPEHRLVMVGQNQDQAVGLPALDLAQQVEAAAVREVQVHNHRRGPLSLEERPSFPGGGRLADHPDPTALLEQFAEPLPHGAGIIRDQDSKLAPHQILVNCVAPGWAATDMSKPALDAKSGSKILQAQIPLGRIAAPEEIAGAILFLASDLATFITGEVLNVNGGAVLCG